MGRHTFIQSLFLALLVLLVPIAQASTVNGSRSMLLDSDVQTIVNRNQDSIMFAGAVNPAKPGFAVENDGDWRFLANDGSTQSDVTSQYILFDGAPALLGVPAESGTLTIGAGNVIADLWTDRIYARPVVFVSLEDPSLTAGVSIVPIAPINTGNQFLFRVYMADGVTADLEGAKLHYMVAEEGWHRLADGRMLLISSAEVRDTGFAGQTIALGASFTNAVTVAQLQRPMLFHNGTLFRNLLDIEVYQGAAVTAGTGDFDSIGLRLMQQSSVEASNGSTVYAGRVGFMVLGNLTSMDKKLNWVKDTSTNIRGGSYLTVPAENFTNYPHSAATSPLLNKAACAEDDDVQNFCVYMSMPVDMFSRDTFKTPRFPYVDADFQPLQMQRTLYSDDNSWGWSALLSNSLINPTIDDNNAAVTGTLAQMHPNFVADRGWDELWYGGQDHWHWFATYHYNSCTYDSMNTACVDYELGDTILDGHELHWTPSTTYNNYSEYTAGKHGAVWGEPPEMNIQQRLFSVWDKNQRNVARINEYVTAPAWAANQAAAYLNYDLPDEEVHFKAETQDPSHNYFMYSWIPMTDIHEESASAWQLHAMNLTARATESYCGTCGFGDFGEYRSWSRWTYSLPYPASMFNFEYGTGRTANPYLSYDWEENFEKRLHVKPFVDTVTRNFRVGDYLFANIPWGLDTSNYRWVRSASKDVATAVTLATDTFGYQASAADADQFITMCMTYFEIERCGDWFEVGNIPYATDVHIAPEFSEPVAGSGLIGHHNYLAPDENNDSQEWGSQYQWQTLDGNHWADISGATENTIDVYIAAGTHVRFCVTPRAQSGLEGPEVCSVAVVMQGDFDGDGYSDDWDSDDDNDGTLDWFDAFPFDDTESLDTDGDGIGNNADLDDDNDGISDEDENAGLTDPLKYDTDGDGTNDLDDPQPTSYGNFPDFDGDGLDDTVDEDRDNDGVVDFYYQVEGKSGVQTLVTEDDVILAWVRIDDDPYSACVANDITVTSNADSGPGTLRQALADLCASDPAADLNTITFTGAMTIALESPLKITKGVHIKGNREVIIDGQNTHTLFEVVMTDHLNRSQFPHFTGLILRNGYASTEVGSQARGSLVQLNSTAFLNIDETLMENFTAPAIAGEDYNLYLNNSLLANVSGSTAALITAEGQLNLSSSTLYNSESGTLTIIGDGSAQLYNSLLLKGPTGSTVCQVSTWTQQTASWVEGSECGITSTGYVALADPENGDYRPIPGSANIEAGPGDMEIAAGALDLLGNDRLMGEYNPDNPIENGGPIYPRVDMGAIEYDYYGDFDGDGVDNPSDAFPNDASETTDTDGDGVGDNSDAFPNDASETVDSDGDGVGDNADAFPTDASESVDTDGDGVGDNSDAFPNDASETLDSDGDGTGDNADTDDDNDGVTDTTDAFPYDATESVDTDGDSIGNNADTDDDNDGVLDAEDAFPLDASESVDTDGDGTGDNADTDDDNDGVLDSTDAFPLDASESVDSDGDGMGDNADTDDDNDGVLDTEDAFPLDASESADTDGDSIGNNADTDDDNDGVLDTDDALPLDASESVDTDGDSIGNNADTDDDNDGVLDTEDVFPLDASESADTDGDSIGNNADTDDDNDGVLDTDDALPLDASESVDTDGDSIGNNADTDDDNDGVLDAEDAFPLDASESVDTDGDSIGNNADSDDDNDGVSDSSDAFPLDATESSDTDGDSIGDKADTDDDDDGVEDDTDNCPLIANADQSDSDGDGVGDACQSTQSENTGGGGATDWYFMLLLALFALGRRRVLATTLQKRS